MPPLTIFARIDYLADGHYIDGSSAAVALFHEADAAGRRHMEYVRDRGIFAEPPIAAILDDFTRTYPKLCAESRAPGIRDKSFHGAGAPDRSRQQTGTEP